MNICGKQTAAIIIWTWFVDSIFYSQSITYSLIVISKELKTKQLLSIKLKLTSTYSYANVMSE